jgi:integrase/recombinase XerD
MIVDSGSVRNVEGLVLPRWGRVAAGGGVVSWLVVDPAGMPVEPVQRFLADFVARGNSPASVRSYAYALHRWWRFLQVVDVRWDRATAAEVRDFVLWLTSATKARVAPRRASLATAGRVNPITRKQYPGDQYAPRTIRHSNAVLRSFYEFWIEVGEGPLLNPVPQDRVGGRRPNAHHNPLEPFRAEGRLRYNPTAPRRRVRAMPDELWLDLFGSMCSNRDRAILALAVSTAARAAELLGIGGADLDWGDQLVRVIRKGTWAQQWLPASPEAFIWLRLYIADIGGIEPDEPIWVTLRRRGPGHRRLPLTHDALRAVLRRANALLGTNWTMHDLRHTAAVRMIRDENLTLRDVQTILGHAHLSSTQVYLDEDDDEVIRRVSQHLAERDDASRRRQPLIAAGYDATALSVLFGGTLT